MTFKQCDNKDQHGQRCWLAVGHSGRHSRAPPSPDAMSHTWKSGYAQAKEEDVLSRRFCPHCNPCDGAGNEECRKPVPPSPDADLVARATAYLTGGGLFNPELANHDAVRNLIIDCRDAIERLTREINLSRQYAAGKDADYVTELGARLAAERERDEARDLCAKLRNEAWVHAQEARTANATIAKIYRACTGGTGEPGNWRGAQPVIDTLARLTRELDEALAECARLRADAERYRWLREQMTHESCGPNVGWTLGLILPGDDPDAAIDAARRGE